MIDVVEISKIIYNGRFFFTYLRSREVNNNSVIFEENHP